MRILVLLGLLSSAIASARTPCEPGEIHFPVDSDECLPKFMATMLSCAVKLGAGHLSIKTKSVGEGTQVIVKADGEGQGLIASGGGHAEVTIKPGTSNDEVERIFSPNVLDVCLKATERSFPAEETKRKRTPPAQPASPTRTKGKTSSAPPAPEEKLIRIPANEGWKDVFWLKPGKIARITASGTWHVIRESGPGGNGTTARRSSFVAQGSPEGALIVRDGKQNLHAFGSNDQEIVIGTEGQISFQANDESSPKNDWGHSGFSDNNGELTVKIVVESAQ